MEEFKNNQGEAFTAEQLKWREENKDKTGSPENHFMKMPNGVVENIAGKSQEEIDQMIEEAKKSLN